MLERLGSEEQESTQHRLLEQFELLEDHKGGTWMSPKVIGTPPSLRTYHTSSAVIGDHLYVFGGGNKGVDPVKDQQLHIFDSATLTWLQPEVWGDPPAPRHGHAMVAVENRLYIHGGLAEKRHWTKLEFKTPVPSARLDQSMCVVPWKVSSNEDSNGKEGAGGSNGDNLSQGCPDEHLCLVSGGMHIKG
ncbi:effector with kelch motifs isoform X2 [Podarcis lilfordi]|uniref:Rab9 effector protein with kelch motifs n=1 Tax=Podarcis lilfordi TaxID=74358 RepID=A0AA35PT05_9SAUR|nr:effector with kelch motifs isoform X2 [Podarcis lilfordi]